MAKPDKKRSHTEMTTRSILGHQVETCCDEKGVPQLWIDGREIHMEVRESGVISHDFAFAEFGSAEELAEALVRQWGQAKIAFTPMEGGGGHGHGGGGHGGGGHHHGDH